jgi:primosomal protein N'
VVVHNARGHETTVCEGCADSDFFRCHHCDGYFHNDNGITTDDGETYCEDCASEHVRTCEQCGVVSDDLDQFDDDGNCKECQEDEEDASAEAAAS